MMVSAFVYIILLRKSTDGNDGQENHGYNEWYEFSKCHFFLLLSYSMESIIQASDEMATIFSMVDHSGQALADSLAFAFLAVIA